MYISIRTDRNGNIFEGLHVSSGFRFLIGSGSSFRWSGPDFSLLTTYIIFVFASTEYQASLGFYENYARVGLGSGPTYYELFFRPGPLS